MLLEINRVILRNFNRQDLDDLFEYAQVEEIGLNAGWMPHSTKNNQNLF